MQHSNARSTAPTAALIALIAVTGCTTPSIPANVIRDDAHSVGVSLAYSSDSQQLASGGAEGTIRLWRMPQATALTRWQAHAGAVQGLAFLRQDRMLLSAGWDGTLATWDSDGNLLARVHSVGPIIDIALDEASNVLVTGHGDGTVRLWRLAELVLDRAWPLNAGGVRAVAYHPASRRIGASADRTFHWRIDEQTPRALAPTPSAARTLAFSPDGRWLTGGGWFNLFQWQLADGELTTLPTEHHGLIPSIQYSGDGNTLVTISRQTDSSIYFIDPATGKVQERYQPHALCGVRVRLSPNGRYLASTSDDASVRVWDLEHTLPKQTTYVRNLPGE
jgi:WD40 repeat protein